MSVFFSNFAAGKNCLTVYDAVFSTIFILQYSP